MKITRIDETTLELADGRIVSYEAEGEEQTDDEEETDYEDGRDVSRTVEYSGYVFTSVTTDPETSRRDKEEILEFLNLGK